MIVPYAVRGELWYQGEGNAGAPKPYYKIFIKYAEMMRAILKNPEMPIYTVQLPDYTNKEWPAFRDVQRRIAMAVPHGGIAVTIDGHEMELHPTDKTNVIKRLSEMALADVYGKKYDAHSPIAPQLKLSGKNVKIKFDNAYKGLKTSDGKAPRTFEVSADGKNFVEADARITGKDEVTLKLPESVSTPVKVRYGWAPDPDVNLFNSADLPVSPFEGDIE
jgi:sialate O-acetylesterase